jgi:WD40 repeat protein/DNA-binding SARP family transcriptional activator
MIVPLASTDREGATMSHLAISLLGTFTVQIDGEPVTNFGYDKVRALLAYLVVESDHPHRRERLTGLLWPEYEERAARTNLRNALANLRSALGDREANPPFLLITRESLHFNPACDYELDVAAFEAHNVDEDRADLDQLTAVIDLYGGDFLSGFSLSDAPGFDEWASLTRERLQHRMLDILDRLSDAHTQQGAYAKACTYARLQLDLDPLRESAHRQMMIARALDGQRNAALVQYETCREILARELNLEPASATTSLYTAIREGELTSYSDTLDSEGSTQAPGPTPFKGLQFFDVDDAGLFFGREALTERVVRRLTSGETFLSVIGASGSGKSSLVRAGLAATLQSDSLPGSGAWSVDLITPGAHPLLRLARRFANDTDVTPLTEAMQDDPEILLRMLTAQTSPPDNEKRRAVIVDQFEELFTLCHNPAQRRAFVANLLAAADAPNPIAVVIALRADFYHHCARYDSLRQALEAHQVYIGAMTSTELRRAIERPARRLGWSFEPGLVDLILKDVNASANQPTEPGALPLLSHALLETWKRRRGRMLTLAGYAEVGGVRGAIAQSAESVYRTLPPDERRIARRVFLRLTALGQSDEAETLLVTRRRVSFDEIAALPHDPEAIRRVLEALTAARLVTVQRNAVEVAHEALIREWPALQSWLQEDLESLRIHRRLTDASHRWERAGRDPSDLYRGARLAQAETWVEDDERALTTLERAFLNASVAERQRRVEARESQRRRELQAAQQLADAQQRRAEERGRLLRWLAVAAGFLLIAAVAAGLLGRSYRAASRKSAILADANAAAADDNAAIAATAQAAEAQAVRAQEQEAQLRAQAEQAQEQETEQRKEAEAAREQAQSAREEAETQARVAQSNLLMMQSNRLLEENYALALLLSAQAYDVLDSHQTRDSMLTVLEAYPGLMSILHAPPDFSPEQVLFSPDGNLLAASSRDALIFWNLVTRELIEEPWPKTFVWGDLNSFRTMAYSPDGTVLASGGCSNFDDNDTCVRGGIALWDTDTGSVLTQLQDHTYTIRGLTYNPAGTHLASCGDETVLLWDMQDIQSTEMIHRLEGHTTPVSAVAFSPDSTLLASVGTDFDAVGDPISESPHFVRLWDVKTGTLVRRLSYLGHGFANLTFNSDGTILAAGACNRWRASTCDQGLIRRWDVNSGEEILPPITAHTDLIHSAYFIEENAVLLSIPWGNSIGLWDTETNTPHHDRIAAIPSTGLSALSPDATTLATVHDTKALLWDIEMLQNPTQSRLATTLASYGPAWLTSLDASPDRSLLGVGSSEGQVHLLESSTGRRVKSLTHAQTGFMSVGFSPDGGTLASGGMDATIQLWDITKDSPVQKTLRGHTGAVTDVAFSPDGKLLASCSDDTSVRLWDASTGELLSVNQGMSVEPTPKLGFADMNVWDVAFSPDGSRLAAAIALPEKVAVLWDISDPKAPKEIARLPSGEEGGITQVVFSPDGTLLAASVGLTGRALLWDLQTLELATGPIPAHSYTTWPLAFTSDGKTLATGSLDSTVRLIDVGTGNLIGPPLRHHTRSGAAIVSGLAFDADGKHLYASSTDGTIRRWDVDPNSWRERICDIAGRNLTQAEWAQYLPGEPYQITCEQWPTGH